MANRKPRLIVFDLDQTLWPWFVDGTGAKADSRFRAPFCKKKIEGEQGEQVFDSWGKLINISSEVAEILKFLKDEDFRIAVASSTRQIEGAEELIVLFGWDEYIDYKQIFPGSKLKHFQRLKQMSDCEFNQMLFFDDDIRYVTEVGTLGVFCVQVTDCINMSTVREGLRDFASHSTAY